MDGLRCGRGLGHRARRERQVCCWRKAPFSTWAVAASLDGSTMTLWATFLFDGLAEAGVAGDTEANGKRTSFISKKCGCHLFIASRIILRSAVSLFAKLLNFFSGGGDGAKV